MILHENNERRQNAVLVAVDLGEYDVEVSLNELENLSLTAGAQVIAKISQKREGLDMATCVGSGKLEEIKEFAALNAVDALIFDHELSASQIRNIENATGIAVIDRTMLILDIFAQRANSGEGRLQVELAQQRYRLPRLTGLGTSLSRLGGGIGTRGPGETKLETDRRHIRARISALEKQLGELEQHRRLLSDRRRKDNLKTVAIVGYTNTGKTTLLNMLTGAEAFAKDMLFATLDPTARGLVLPDGRTVIVTDTVGFIRRLPHHLVEAFKSTLEEAASADLILNVCDASSDEAAQQQEVARAILKKLKASHIPVITVLNKCDMAEAQPYEASEATALISAKTGAGIESLLNKIARNLPPTQHRVKLLLPYDKAGMAAQIRSDGKVYAEEFTPDGILLDALVENAHIYKVENFITQA